jgi:hypothetical protein
MEFRIFSEGYYVLFHPKFHPMKSRYVGTYLILVLDPTYVAFLRGTLISFPVPSPCSFEVTTFASRWRSWRLARTDAIAQWRPVQARIPHLEVRGKVAYAWLGRILEGGAKNIVLLSRVGIFLLISRRAAVAPLLSPRLRRSSTCALA